LIEDVTPQHRLLGQSALQAYQSDAPVGGIDPTQDDQAAVLAATLLRQSLIGGDDAAAERLRSEAERIARDSLGQFALDQGCTYDDHPSRSRTDIIRRLVQRTEHAGRLNLAQHLLESVAEIEEDPASRGRVLGDRARVSRKLGHLDLSFEQSQELLRMGRRAKLPELVALAYAVASAVAETRGNRTEFRELSKRSLRVARAGGFRHLQASGYFAMGTSDAMASRYGDAVANYWRAFGLVGGAGQIARAVLGNLATTLLISGRPLEARKVSTMVLQQPGPAISALPSLGTYALASANLGDVDAVLWASGQVRQFGRLRHAARELAEAMIECSAALEAIGREAQAGVLKRRGEAIAQRHGFHDLTFEEAAVSARGRPSPVHFDAAAAGAAAEIEELDVPRIPADLAVALG
jgi:hypothetical protein